MNILFEELVSRLSTLEHPFPWQPKTNLGIEIIDLKEIDENTKTLLTFWTSVIEIRARGKLVSYLVCRHEEKRQTVEVISLISHLVSQWVLLRESMKKWDQESMFWRASFESCSDPMRLRDLKTNSVIKQNLQASNLEADHLVNWVTYENQFGRLEWGENLEQLYGLRSAWFEKERLREAGLICASIAHEINNPLGTMNNVQYILKSEPWEDKAAVEELGQCLHRMKLETSRLLSTVRTSEVQDYAWTSLKPVLARVKNAIERLYHKTKFVFEVAEDDQWFYGRTQMVEASLMNLLTLILGHRITSEGDLRVLVSRQGNVHEVSLKIRILDTVPHKRPFVHPLSMTEIISQWEPSDQLLWAAFNDTLERLNGLLLISQSSDRLTVEMQVQDQFDSSQR